ncbi:hypothetical protein COBT_001940 [Conglomerata obtusa]
MKLLFLAIFIFDIKGITVYDESVKQIERGSNNKIHIGLSIDSKSFSDQSNEDKNETNVIEKSFETKTNDNAAHTHINENNAKNYKTVDNETSFFANRIDDIGKFGKNLQNNTENSEIVNNREFAFGNETYSTETTDEIFKDNAENGKADTNKDTARLSKNLENNKEIDITTDNNASADENAVYNTAVGENSEYDIANNKKKINEVTASRNVVDYYENIYANVQTTATLTHDTNLVGQKIAENERNHETTVITEPINSSDSDNTEVKITNAIPETFNNEDMRGDTSLQIDEHIKAFCENTIQIENNCANAVSLNLQNNNEEVDWENEYEIITVNYEGDDNYYVNHNPSVDLYKEDKHLIDVRFLVKVPKYISIALRLYNFFIMEARNTKSQSQSADLYRDNEDIEDSDGFVLLDMSIQDHMEYIFMEKESAEIFNFGVRYPIENNKMDILKKLWLLYHAVAENKTMKSVNCYTQIAQILAKNFYIYNFYEEITNCVKMTVTTSIYI